MSGLTHEELGATVSKRVRSLCRARGIHKPPRIAFYVRCVCDALTSPLLEQQTKGPLLDREIQAQTKLLREALETLPQRMREETARARAAAAAATTQERLLPADASQAAADTPSPLSLEEKLSASRDPIKKLLAEDCIQLGLITPERAKELILHLTGKMPEQAEQDINDELRNNLHSQVRKIIRDLKGGPWKSVKQQEDIRLDIANTRSINSVLSLTRQLFQERDNWEKAHCGKSVIGRLTGRLKVTFGKH